jgi:stage II sporulation protein D
MMGLNLVRKHFTSVFLVILAVNLAGAQTRRSNWQRAVDQVASAAPDARIVITDRAAGSILAFHQLKAASRTLSAPGSALKPLLLYRALETEQWDASNRIACDRKLMIGQHRLACSHREVPPLDAREALAWSCNSYFAAMARAFRPGQLMSLLRPTGLLDPTGLMIGEAIAKFREPESFEEQQLAMLGVSNIRITPLELAVAYRWLANEIARHPESAAARTVAAGLADSADFGMASGAGAGGASVAGKTGTAEGSQSSRTHGWFAGLAPVQNPKVVIVVYLPNGRGADAARVAGEILVKARLTLR